MDDLSVTDHTFAESIKGACATDNLTVKDGVQTGVSYARGLVSDGVQVTDDLRPMLLADRSQDESLTLSDAVHAGLWRDVLASDTVVITELCGASTEYSRSDEAEVTSTDVVRPWTPALSQLQVHFSGGAAVLALLLQKTSEPVSLNRAPSRTVSLPKGPPPVERSYVVNPDPRDR